MKPFKELLVVETASVLAGPSVGLFFAELGAQLKQWTGKFVNLGEAMQEYGDGLVGLG